MTYWGLQTRPWQHKGVLDCYSRTGRCAEVQFDSTPLPFEFRLQPVRLLCDNIRIHYWLFSTTYRRYLLIVIS